MALAFYVNNIFHCSKVDPLVESDEIQVAERIKRRCK